MDNRILEADLHESQVESKCGVCLVTPDAGRCIDCGRPAPSLVGGYCVGCAAVRGVNPLKVAPDLP